MHGAKYVDPARLEFRLSQKVFSEHKIGVVTALCELGCNRAGPTAIRAATKIPDEINILKNKFYLYLAAILR